ncbi:MAG: D-Ala-D-Ala carboxypeptidase family metallohydrolase [Bryobacteraceae bacterium]
MFNAFTSAVNALLNNDVQVQPVGMGGLDTTAVVVKPGPDIPLRGALGNTNNQGDDVCTVLRGNVCIGAILAGPNGIADTTANNRHTVVDFSDQIASGYRNPQRNRRVGSVQLDSYHQRGRALDITPVNVPGKTTIDMYCLMVQAGKNTEGGVNSFTEFSAVPRPCTAVVNHIHVQRPNN